jgi:hypothetical protein
MNLNGWQRLGVVASVVWAPIGFFGGNSIGIHEGDPAVASLKACMERGEDWKLCQGVFSNEYAIETQYHWLYGAMMTVLPIIFAWLLVWVGTKVFRWVRVGFAQS